MADSKRIEIDFKQAGDVCVLASYSIVIDYFSNKALKQPELFTRFIGIYSGLQNIINKELNQVIPALRKKRREDLISAKFHEHCRNNGDKRGFDYFAELHAANKLGSNSFCDITSNNAVKFGNVPQLEREQLRESLKGNETLAMVLYRVNEVALHAVVVGYDDESKKYFVRDPNIKEINYDDILLNKEITEYILFSGK